MQDREKFKHEGPHVLLTEGVNDCHLIASLCNYFKVPTDIFGLYRCDSDDKVLRRLSALLGGSIEMKTIGVVLDADAPGLVEKWAALTYRLEAEGYSVPGKPSKCGTIMSLAQRPTVGIWLMPDNDVDGMLEDFCLRLAPPAAIEYAQKCVADAKESGFSSFGDTHFSKAAIHTFLSWQDEPGMPMGQAVTRKALDPTYPLATQFHSFLRSLFFPVREVVAIPDSV